MTTEDRGRAGSTPGAAGAVEPAGPHAVAPELGAPRPPGSPATRPPEPVAPREDGAGPRDAEGGAAPAEGSAAPLEPPVAAVEEAVPAAEQPVAAVEEAVPAPEEGGTRSGRRRGWVRRLLPAPVWHIGRLLIVALIIEYLVVPQIAGSRKVADLVTQVDPLLLLLGVALEAASLLAYAQLSRTVLPVDRDLGLYTMLRIQLTTLSVSHCVPGGTAAGSSLGYRLMTQAGVARTDVGFALAMQGLGSALVLNVIFWLALVVSIPVWGFSAVYLIAALAGVVLMVAAAGLLVLFTRGKRRAGDWLERVAGRLPFVDGAVLRRSFERLAERLHDLGRQRRLLGKAVGWAAANWLLDAASLAVFVGAFGHWVNPDGLLVAYGLANVLAVIPLTPGGLGVVEATLTSTLVGFGTTRGVAILGVVAYRLINFWLPIPLGGLAYLSLQVDPHGSTAADRRSRLRRAARWLATPVTVWGHWARRRHAGTRPLP